MRRLEAQFGDRIDFWHLDIQDPGIGDVMAQYGLTGRTQYMLVDTEGNVIIRWFGYIIRSEEEIAAELAAALAIAERNPQLSERS